jgi:uncharacterized membrane protein YjgN (DUF898 family)
MKIQNKLFIFVCFFCIIIITMILFSFVFNVITKRLFGTNPIKTKLYYLEMFGTWLILAYIMFNIRTNVNEYSKKEMTKYVKSNGETDDYLYDEIDELGKFALVLIIGFFIIFIGSRQHTYKEKLGLLNEDIAIIADSFR